MSKPVILFACVHNGGRSLAAKVLTEHYGAGAVEVRSAGSEPGSSLNPTVVQVLHDRGLSTDAEAPKLLTYDGVQEADLVITMGCGETCPVFPGKRYQDWELDDPKGQDLETVQRIVGEIDQRVRALLAELDINVPTNQRPPNPDASVSDTGPSGTVHHRDVIGSGLRAASEILYTEMG